MKRQIFTSLVEWKNSHDRKPLILEGARQVGKTYILKEFGNQEFENMVYVNCQKDAFIKQIFEQDFDMERIIRSLSAHSRIKITPSKTLIFLDEIQEVSRAFESLKYFCEDAPEYHVVVAGSLLGLLNHAQISYPVGKVDIMRLYPMSFEEFLWAKGEQGYADILADKDWSLIAALSSKYEDLLRQYYYVGGMPAVVKSYVDKEDLQAVRTLQNSILSNYSGDFSKHAGKEAERIRMVWESIPSQLSRENKKFSYGAVKSGGRAKEFEIAIQWLVDAGLVHKIHRCKKPEIPLSFFKDSSAFKLYMLDVGLLGAMAKIPAKYLLISNEAFKQSKGAFTENFVLQQLVNRARIDMDVYYFSKDSSTLEVDFLLQDDDRVVPMEVKSEENVKSKSLRYFVQVDFADLGLKGLRASMKGYVDQDWMENIPLYAVGPYFTR